MFYFRKFDNAKLDLKDSAKLNIFVENITVSVARTVGWPFRKFDNAKLDLKDSAKFNIVVENITVSVGRTVGWPGSA